ncbi:MAG: hypothetical protein FJ098_03025 [Deltaproteobacteria bacterium]|nr:hypothetical protein [Deltaproteobacteria bacterium]
MSSSTDAGADDPADVAAADAGADRQLPDTGTDIAADAAPDSLPDVPRQDLTVDTGTDILTQPDTGEDVAPDTCQPACGGKDCGDDGCAGTCGTCDEHYACIEGLCTLQPWCGDGICDTDPPEDKTSCPQDCGGGPNLPLCVEDIECLGGQTCAEMGFAPSVCLFECTGNSDCQVGTCLTDFIGMSFVISYCTCGPGDTCGAGFVCCDIPGATQKTCLSTCYPG